MAQPIDLVRPSLFWPRVDVADEMFSCWTWRGKQDRHGYGEHQQKHEGRHVTWRAHRVAYELMVGPIPDGLVLDHLCRNRMCVNPSHLEPVTDAENKRRGRGHPRPPESLAAACPNGHPYVEGSYLQRKGGRWRTCKVCAAERQKRWSAKDHRV